MGPDGAEFNQTRALCQICTEGMVCDQPGLNYTQIFPEYGYYPKKNTGPQTMEMIKCISTGVFARSV